MTTETNTLAPEIKRAIVHAWDQGLSAGETAALLQLGESLVTLEFDRLDKMYRVHRVYIEDCSRYL